MPQADPIIADLMSPGASFEVVSENVAGRSLRVFKNAPERLTDVFETARGFGPMEFIVSGERRLTFEEFFDRSDRFAAWLVNEKNIKPGQSVAICMKNSPEWMIAFVGILYAGAVAVLVNSRGTGEEMRRAITDADSVMVVGDHNRLEKLHAAECPVPCVSDEDMADLPALTHPVTAPKRKPEDLAAMFFTSGTTGRAKAPAISHRNLVTGVMNTQMAMAAVFQKMAASYNITVEVLRSQMPQSCSLLVFPLFHTSGCGAVFLTAFTTGGKLVLMDRWDGDAALKLVEQEKITTIGGVPTMLWDILRAETLADRDLSSLMSLSCGGQALPLNLLAEIRKTFPRAFIGAGYGMTETSGAISQANGEAFVRNPQASGQILPMMDVQITDDHGEPCETGDVGEIWVKGAALMQGYYGRPEDTAKSMSGEWFKTGDIGRVDAEGYIYIVDRKTDMVISGGENIYCAEVEQVLSSHPDVLQVTTFGVPDDRLGERLVASVLLNDMSADLLAFAKDNLADYKVPTDITVTEKPFLLNAMGKIEKQAVREAYLASLNLKDKIDAAAN